MTEPRFSDYTVVVRPLSADEGGGYFASIAELPGCGGDGETREAAIKDVEAAFSAWVDTARSMGREVPPPHAANKPVAALIRFPRTMHAELTQAAEYEGISFNQLVVTALGTYLGSKATARTMNTWSGAFVSALGVSNVVGVAGKRGLIFTTSATINEPWSGIERRRSATATSSSSRGSQSSAALNFYGPH